MEYDLTDTEIADGISSEGEFHRYNLTKMDIHGLMPDFDVINVKDSMEEDAVGKVNDMHNHLCVYSSSEEVTKSKQDELPRSAEVQQEAEEDDGYRNELIALFSDNSDRPPISNKGKEFCNIHDQLRENHFGSESEMIVAEKGDQEAGVGNGAPEKDGPYHFYNEDLWRNFQSFLEEMNLSLVPMKKGMSKGGISSRSRKPKGVRKLRNLKSSINYEKCIRNEGGKGVFDNL